MDYLTIGEVAKLADISVQTLRYYDNIDLFKPEFTNPQNHYRYYGIRQLFYLETIKYLRRLDISIKQIKEIIVLPPKQLSHFLKNYRHEIDQQLTELHAIKALLNNQIELLTDQNLLLSYPDGEVYQRKIDSRQVLTLPDVATVTPEVQPDLYFRDLYAQLDQQNLDAKAYQYNCVFALDDYQRLSNIHYQYLFVTILNPHSSFDSDLIKTLDEGHYLCIKFNWNLDNYLTYLKRLKKAYQTLRGHQKAQVIEVSSPNHSSSDHEESFVTELQIKL
ncbi:MerR family transcriptional regulator [Holzapfeliella sp. He02]|uniref:MerR family transcriptional regulator n=1 Tax=Holzapfeliella saturejae TaxID=3082953 RepID=A0ABU8SJP5_9LACO